ncbi:conjugal transfer protein TraD [Xanthomonas campestris pv. campestris]|uniref:conjugal transfer protein TraD n=1 Tax=Xanthomonas campestris TaxID=339 RepID=UPI001A13EB73|nr:conjugal transfer protein TraD [Xanthomonas campestris]MBF9173183.1 conjugal transfer protein TraD [Xanthomonas campestris pv. campestris]MDO0846764.1 conjugal transfer protein TraD [Xanthomonas campestris pv. campestris]MEB1411967.1 conjugal transfer protein TraD [Xanthomonas campestris pv. campestris]MEB1457942.1 conjugal transfer protein TraD [Xanthomonas campestris pv. campestris]MEB1498784.1 conjugal transfer protein TraD [Xanthomonas campestris pv. campestris]
MKKKSLEERAADADKRARQLKAQLNLKDKRERVRVAKAEDRKRLAQAMKWTRQKDAHRKIELGGVVIAAGADQMDPAELCGLLLLAIRNLDPHRLPALREIGIRHFDSRRTQRK